MLRPVVFIACVPAVLLSACDGSGSLSPPSGVMADCGDTPPVITALEVEEGEPFTLANGSQVPGLNVNVKLTDADMDLHWYEMKVWFDGTLDGAVAPEGTYYETYGPRGDLDCGVGLTEVPLRVAVNGYPAAGEPFEVGVIVYDDAGNPTNGGVPTVAEFLVEE